MVSVQVSQVTDFAALGRRWRDLEQRSDGSFFQSWTWLGTLAPERFARAVLVEATEAGRTVALGLFNRVRRFGPSTLYLGESGSADLDCPYLEQNGILTETGRDEELTRLCLRPLLATHDIALSGVGEPVAAAVHRAAGLVLPRLRQESPFIDLAAIRRSGADYLAGRSANTRQQVRRSDRFYQREGPVSLQRAGSLHDAHAMLEEMAALHQSTWRSRGRPGSFARPFFGRFHHALIDSAFPRGETDLLKISRDGAVIGILYNFIWKRRLSAYQSGFAYQDGQTQAKPGLTCHHAAICDAMGQGIDIYDFLAGDDRYKRSLADQSNTQFWLTAGPAWSPRLLPRVIVRRLRGIAAGVTGVRPPRRP